MCCCDDYKMDGCFWKLLNFTIDLATAICIIAIIVMTAVTLTYPASDGSVVYCLMDGNSGATDYSMCSSVYIAAAISAALAIGAAIIHCFTCCFHRLGFFIEAACEICQAILWIVASSLWQDNVYSIPQGSAEFVTAFNEATPQRNAVANLGFVIAIMQLTLAVLASIKAIRNCCCSSKDEDRV
mmetsp:Transcript_28430/g.80228  ORF Transcript_28430/g.80228 Transcript_28430/m.80228 type:complete len:184 (-) Transcript_28430:2380-2931(-)